VASLPLVDNPELATNITYHKGHFDTFSHFHGKERQIATEGERGILSSRAIQQNIGLLDFSGQ
jgi:hypothetical protein